MGTNTRTRTSNRGRHVVPGPAERPPRATAPLRAAPGAAAAVRTFELPAGLTIAGVARVLTGLLWVTWAAWLNLQPPSSARLTQPLIWTALAAAGVAVMAAAVLARDERSQRRLDVILITGTIVLVVLLPVVASIGGGYSTDELAYDQSAAAALLHGLNPYSVNLAPALQTFGVGNPTVTLHGTIESNLNYPALSFLLYVPSVLLFGAQSYAGMLSNAIAWGAAGWIMWRLLSPSLRPWIPVLLALPAFLGGITYGDTDSLFVPFVLVAVCAWDRFADPEEPRGRRWIGPIALGLACCVKQQPWLIAPFLLAGVSIEAHVRGRPWWRTGAGYAAIAGTAFLVPNLAFVAWDPGAWLHDLFTPLTGALVPMGLGPAGLLRPLATGGGNLGLFGLAAGAAFSAALALLLIDYARMRRIVVMLPLAALFLSTRSLAAYFVYCVPALVVGAATLRSAPALHLGPRLRRALTGASAALGFAAAAFVVAAIAAPAPLSISVAHSKATASQLTIVADVTNTTDRPLSPNFFLAKNLDYNQVFTSVAGPATLNPGARAEFTLTATENAGTPHEGDEFQVQAGTLGPDAISSSDESIVGRSS